MRKIILVAFLLLLAFNLWGQRKQHRLNEEKVRQIRTDSDRYWCDITSDLLQNVKKQADLRDRMKHTLKLGISNQIKSYVYGKITVQETDNNGQTNYQSERNIQISSNLFLKNLQYLEYEKDKKLYVFAYLLKSDFEAQENEMIQQILDVKKLAQNQEANGELAYLYTYYKAYLMTYNITRSFRDASSDMDVQHWLENKINSILSSLPIKAVLRSSTTPKFIPVDIILSSEALPTGLLFDVPVLSFYNVFITENKGSFFYEGEPSTRFEELKISLRINPEIVKNLPEIYDIAINRKTAVERMLPLDFTGFFQVDFEYQITENQIRLTPNYSGFSVSNVEWHLGDGNIYKNTDGIFHTYQSSGKYTIKMIVNNDVEICKTIEIHKKEEIPLNIDFDCFINEDAVTFSPLISKGLIIEKIIWDLGDGNIIRQPEKFVHQYSRPGLYKVILSINDYPPVMKILEIKDIPQIPDELQPLKEEEKSPEAPISSIPEPSEPTNPFVHAEPQFPEEGKDLLQYRTSAELITYLEQQKRERNLAYGRFDSSTDISQAWIVIFEYGGEITAILYPFEGKHYDNISKQVISDIFGSYRGKQALYVSFY